MTKLAFSPAALPGPSRASASRRGCVVARDLLCGRDFSVATNSQVYTDHFSEKGLFYRENGPLKRPLLVQFWS